MANASYHPALGQIPARHLGQASPTRTSSLARIGSKTVLVVAPPRGEPISVALTGRVGI